MNKHCEALADRFRTMEGQGLVDVKFLLRNTDEATLESVCEEVGGMMDAFERGEAVNLDFKDSKRVEGHCNTLALIDARAEPANRPAVYKMGFSN